MPTTPRIQVNPSVLQWALDSVEESRRLITEQRTAVLDWISGDKKPTAKQLAEFAKKVAIPFGYLLLATPPNIGFEHAYFRKGISADSNNLSVNAKALVRETDKKSAWAEEYLRENGKEKLSFIGSANVKDSAEEVALNMHSKIQYNSSWTKSSSSWSGAKRALISAIEAAGIHVIASGVVGNNTSRPIDPEELNGFAIIRPRAPFVYVNSKDFVARQIFTLVHELAHIWTGTSAIDAVSFEPDSNQDITEHFCDSVASYFLVPDNDLKSLYLKGHSLSDLAQQLRVSSFAINRALFDRNYINREEYIVNLVDLKAKVIKTSSGGGGDFFVNANVRNSRLFIELLQGAYSNKNIDYRGASRLLDLRGKSLVKVLAQ